MKLTYRSWVERIERWHRGIAAGSMLACLLASASLYWLRLDMDVLAMLPHGRPAFDDFRDFVADFGELDELTVLVEGERRSAIRGFADEFAARLRRLDSVGSVQARVDFASLLDGLFGRYLYNYVPDEEFGALERKLTPAGIEVQMTANRALLASPFDLSTARAVTRDPLGIERLAAQGLGSAAEGFGGVGEDGYVSSVDGDALVLFARPAGPALDIEFSARLMDEVRAAERESRRAVGDPALEVRYTGSYVYALEDAATLKRDVARYAGFALAGVLAVFYLGYRSLRIVPFVAYPLLLTTLTTFAVSLLLFRELNAVSMSFAAVLYGLSIDSGIHFYCRLIEEWRRAERTDALAAVTATLAGLGRANVAASATTAAAFLVIGGSSLGAVRQLGVLTAVGMVVTVAQFFVVFPALGFLLLRAAPRGLGASGTPRLARWSGAAAGRAVGVAGGAGLVAAVLLAAACRVGLDASLTRLRPRNSEATRVQEEVATRFGSRSETGAVLARGAGADEALARAEDLAQRLREYAAQGMVGSLRAVEAVVPSARTQQARLDMFNRLPRDAAIEAMRESLARQGFAAKHFEEFFETFRRPREAIVRVGDAALAPLEFFIDHHVRLREGKAIVATYVQPAAGVEWRALAERLRGDFGPRRPAVAARSLVEDELEGVMRRELRVFWIVGVASNLVLLWIGFGSVLTALAVLAPVIVALIGLFAGMWLAGKAVDPVNIIVTPMIFGVGVDYGVYIASRAREEGIRDAILHSGRPVAIAAFTTMAGFGFLGLSEYPALASVGLLTGAGLSLCLVLSFGLLPALLALVPGTPVGLGKGGDSAGAPREGG